MLLITIIIPGESYTGICIKSSVFCQERKIAKYYIWIAIETKQNKSETSDSNANFPEIVRDLALKLGVSIMSARNLSEESRNRTYLPRLSAQCLASFANMTI